MLHLSAIDLRRPPPAEGFAWWYCDVVSPSGEGLVVLGSVGLPFVPARRGEGAAVRRPSLALSVYRNAREEFYLLSSGHADSSWEPERGIFRFGKSELRIEEQSGRVRFRADLDASLPGGHRLRGAVDLAGPLCRLPIEAAGARGTHALGDAHAWSPLAAACDARASLQLGDAGAFELEGRGYLDGNRSELPLHELGIRDWRWGRLAFPDREIVWFHLRPPHGEERTMVLEITRDGAVRSLEGARATFDDRLPTLFGLRRTAELRLSDSCGVVASVRFECLVDDGPFYHRYLVEAVDAKGARAKGFAERVVPGRVARPWQRPFVEMRIQREGELGSRWLPLFSGPRRGRWSRLAASWAQRMVGP